MPQQKPARWSRTAQCMLALLGICGLIVWIWGSFVLVSTASVEMGDALRSATLHGDLSRDGVSIETTEARPLDLAELSELEEKEEDDQDPKGEVLRQSTQLGRGFCPRGDYTETTLAQFSKRQIQIEAPFARAPPA